MARKTTITGEGIRQRSIIKHLAASTNSASKTRTAIAQNIAQENNDWVALLILANDLNIELPAFTEDVSKLVVEDMDQKRISKFS